MKIHLNLVRINKETLFAAFIMFLTFNMIVSCKNGNKSKSGSSISIYSVTALAETKPVPRDSTSDAADDPAIWINFEFPDSSKIIGTEFQAYKLGINSCPVLSSPAL